MPIDRMLDLVFGPDPLPCDQRTGPMTQSQPVDQAGPPSQGDVPDLTQPAGGVDTLLDPFLTGADS
jgi:hypothetical protein